jgi:hypothetical protein
LAYLPNERGKGEADVPPISSLSLPLILFQARETSNSYLGLFQTLIKTPNFMNKSRHDVPKVLTVQFDENGIRKV